MRDSQLATRAHGTLDLGKPLWSPVSRLSQEPRPTRRE